MTATKRTVEREIHDDMADYSESAWQKLSEVGTTLSDLTVEELWAVKNDVEATLQRQYGIGD